MASPTAIRSGFVAILQAVQAELADELGLDAARIHIVADRDQPRLDAEQDVLLWPRGFVSQQPDNDGGGRVTTWLVRRLSVITRTRVGELDETGSNSILLTDATLGAFAFEESVLNILQDFFPEDSARNLLTVEPMRVLTGLDPGPAKKEPGWCDNLVDYEIRYAPALTQSRQ